MVTPVSPAPQQDAEAGQGGTQVALLQLAVQGMHCAACVRRVERVLAKVPGVTRVAVNLATGDAWVHVAADATAGAAPAQTAQALVAALGQAGYTGVAQEAGRNAALSARQAREAQWRRDRTLLIVGAALTLPLVLPMLLTLTTGGTGQPMAILPVGLQLACALAVQGLLGLRFYRGAWHTLRQGGADMDVLVALGTTAAIGLSLLRLLQAPAGHGMGHDLYFESSASVLTLVHLGKLLEDRARRSAALAIQALQNLQPGTALRVRDGQVACIPVEAILPGDQLQVPAGERIPVDGCVRSGQSEIDLSLLTGESVPIPVGPADGVTGGALNLQGALMIEAVAVGEDTRLAAIVRQVEQAQASKPRLQRQVDQVSALFVPLVLVTAVATLLGWLWHDGAVAHAVQCAVSVLVIACPCALGLATPMVLLVGTGMAAQAGWLVRDADSLLAGARVTHVALDKTGTLTIGQPELLTCLDATAAAARTRAEATRSRVPAPEALPVLVLAQAVQQGSTHPLARAVRQAAEQAGLPAAEVTPANGQAQVLAGRGLQAEVDGRTLALLRPVPGDLPPDWPAGGGPAPSDALLHHARAALAQGCTVTWLVTLAPAAQVLGLLGFRDRLRPEAQDAVAALQALGCDVHLLSGDHPTVVAQVAGEAGIGSWQAGLLPADKRAQVARWQAAGIRVGMVGDGLNDAPVLAQADLGIAMGEGSDAALAAAGVVLLHQDLRQVARVVQLGRRVARRIHINLVAAFAYNVVGIPLAAAGLLSPALAGLAMAASSISVVASALLLRRAGT